VTDYFCNWLVVERAIARGATRFGCLHKSVTWPPKYRGLRCVGSIWTTRHVLNVIEHKAHPNPPGKKLNGLQNTIVISTLDTLTAVTIV
jgi:hypothetical protein